MAMLWHCRDVGAGWVGWENAYPVLGGYRVANYPVLGELKVYLENQKNVICTFPIHYLPSHFLIASYTPFWPCYL